MKTLLIIGLATLYGAVGNTTFAQVISLPEALSNAEVRSRLVRSNADAKAKADREYLRLHPEQATNALTPHQLELLDISHNSVLRSNFFAQPHSQAELAEFTNTVRYFLTNAAAQNSYFFHLHGITEAEYASNLTIQPNLPVKQWPELSRRTSVLKHAADVLRLAISSNAVYSAIAKQSNPPKAAALRKIAKDVQNQIDLFANALVSPDLKSFVGLGYEATLPKSDGDLRFKFSPGNPTSGVVVRALEKRTPDGQHVLLSARFYENGKLFEFQSNAPKKDGLYDTDEQLVFNRDGTLRSFWKRP